MLGFGMMGGMFLFWIVLIVLAVFLVRWLFQADQTNSTSQPSSARQILEQRYARGEINQEQYLMMLKDIQ
jgi:putative membrane protein